MTTKNEPTLTISKRIEKPVSMIHANGSTYNQSIGFTVTIEIWENEEKTGHNIDGSPYFYFCGFWSLASDNCDNTGSGSYGCGSLTFFKDGKACFDYDGCFDLSHHVCDLLTEKGFDMSEVDSRLF